ncbi:MAG: LysE family transporter [Ignavibacteria bacterium]|nr:LysE family transporter [Ignavibacteria bacterium]
MIIGLVVGVVTGYLLSMPPIGPTNILVMSQGFKNEIKYGVAIGAGAGFMDMIYIIISYGGLALIKGFIPGSVDTFFAENEKLFKVIITFVGCFIVILSGLKIMKTKVMNNGQSNVSEARIEERLGEVEGRIDHTSQEISKIIHTDLLQKKENGCFGGFIRGAFLCVSSVTIPASWFAITGYMKSYGIIDSRFITGFAYSLGVFFGTTLWFYCLVKLISKNSHKVSPAALGMINKVVGVILIGLGVFLFYKAFDFLFIQST